MSVEDDIVKLRGRITALEVATVTQTLLEGASKQGFNPIEFAAQRASFWRQIGQTLNDDGSASSLAFEEALVKLGNLLNTMAKPIDEELQKRPDGGS
ncbi:MAG TPA: hypothetical protein VD846_14965 [Allosphingosinicella sp.]|nr:hypothetical protein [Allosphingosinicella sp.]